MLLDQQSTDYVSALERLSERFEKLREVIIAQPVLRQAVMGQGITEDELSPFELPDITDLPEETKVPIQRSAITSSLLSDLNSAMQSEGAFPPVIPPIREQSDKGERFASKSGSIAAKVAGAETHHARIVRPIKGGEKRNSVEAALYAKPSVTLSTLPYTQETAEPDN